MQKPLPFGNTQQSGYEELAGGTVLAANVVMDGRGAIYRRPGISAYSGAPSTSIDATGLSGIHVSLDGRLWAVSNAGPERPIYLVTSGGATALGGGISPGGLLGSLRPVWCETEMLLVLAGGNLLQKVELQTLLTNRLGGNPPQASHVIANSSHLLCNNLGNQPSQVSFSDVAVGKLVYSGFENWTAGPGSTAGVFTAEARPDPVIALAENTNEVYCWGTTTTQIYAPDPVYTFAPVVTRPTGMSAPYSAINTDTEFYWLDDLRRLVFSDGRSFQVISDPIKATLDTISTISDCWGFRAVLGPIDVFVWVFPTDGRAFCYQKNAGWSEWLGWNDATNNWAVLPISAHVMRPDRSENVVALSDGRIGKLDFAATTDLGNRIRAYTLTGYQNRETDRRKDCKSVRFTLRRGTTTQSDAPVAMFGWREKPGSWDAQIPISLGQGGDTEIVVEFNALGTYRRRQWYFEFSSTTDQLTLVSAVEEYDVMDW